MSAAAPGQLEAADADNRGQAGEQEAPMALDPRIRRVDDIRTAPLFDLVVDLSAPLDFGAARATRRILYGATGGFFRGGRLHGEVVAGGGDWATFSVGGAMIIDVRLTLRTQDDALIHMAYGGRLITPLELRREMADPASRVRVDPAQYYFRTTPSFETGSESYCWLNDIVSVGSGYPIEGGVAYSVFQVL